MVNYGGFASKKEKKNYDVIQGVVDFLVPNICVIKFFSGFTFLIKFLVP